MKNKVAITIISLSFLSAVAFGYSVNLNYFSNAGMTTKTTVSYSATDTVYSQPIKIGDAQEVILSTNLSGTANAGNYIMNDIQANIGGTWVTVATDSAGVGYSSYTLRTDGTITIPESTIRTRTRRYRASGTLYAYQQINGY